VNIKIAIDPEAKGDEGKYMVVWHNTKGEESGRLRGFDTANDARDFVRKLMTDLGMAQAHSKTVN